MAGARWGVGEAGPQNGKTEVKIEGGCQKRWGIPFSFQLNKLIPARCGRIESLRTFQEI